MGSKELLEWAPKSYWSGLQKSCWIGRPEFGAGDVWLGAGEVWLGARDVWPGAEGRRCSGLGAGATRSGASPQRPNHCTGAPERKDERRRLQSQRLSSSKTDVRGSKRRVAHIQQLLGAAFFGGAASFGRLANSEPVGAAQFSVALASLGGAKSARLVIKSASY